MGIDQEQLLPRLQDLVMRRKAARDVRARVCERRRGEVVEVGFGTGLNAPHYPDEVTKIMAVEPSKICMQRAQPRNAGTPTTVELAGLNGEHVDFVGCQNSITPLTLEFARSVPQLAL